MGNKNRRGKTRQRSISARVPLVRLTTQLKKDLIPWLKQIHFERINSTDAGSEVVYRCEFPLPGNLEAERIRHAKRVGKIFEELVREFNYRSPAFRQYFDFTEALDFVKDILLTRFEILGNEERRALMYATNVASEPPGHELRTRVRRIRRSHGISQLIKQRELELTQSDTDLPEKLDRLQGSFLRYAMTQMSYGGLLVNHRRACSPLSRTQLLEQFRIPPPHDFDVQHRSVTFPTEHFPVQLLTSSEKDADDRSLIRGLQFNHCQRCGGQSFWLTETEQLDCLTCSPPPSCANPMQFIGLTYGWALQNEMYPELDLPTRLPHVEQLS